MKSCYNHSETNTPSEWKTRSHDYQEIVNTAQNIMLFLLRRSKTFDNNYIINEL